MNNPAFEPNDFADLFRQFENGHVLARTDIDMAVAGIDLHKMHAGVGTVVDMQKLSPRCAGSPDNDRIGADDLGIMRLADQSRHHMTAGKIKVVAGSV